MELTDFKPGVIFFYNDDPDDNADEYYGIGEIIEVVPVKVDGVETFHAHIKWVWYPANKAYVSKDWYYGVDIGGFGDADGGWLPRCKVIDEKEKLKLFLKYSFG